MSPREHQTLQRETRASDARALVSRVAGFGVFGFVILLALAVECVGTSHAQTPPDPQGRASQKVQPFQDQPSQDQPSQAEKASYADALAYCRSNVPHPIALRDDKRVACFDGEIRVDLDLSLVEGLETGGLFVVRSRKGETIYTIKLAELLRKKQATIIINGYCLANCANYISFAAPRTFVPRGALVAWHYVGEHGECIRLSETSDHSAPRFDVGACRGSFHDNGRNEYIDQLRRKFYEDRAPSFAMPPESVVVRRALKARLDATGAIPAVYWTWNPRNYAGTVKTKIFYEAYPQSQEEVDAIAAHIGVGAPVIYDP